MEGHLCHNASRALDACVLVLEFAFESVDLVDEGAHAVLGLGRFLAVNRVEAHGEVDMRFNFTRRADCNSEESSELSRTAATCTLGDVGGDGDRRSSHLGRQSVALN